ncbi:MAG: cytochrome c family protein [Rhodospirillaceae bacterium]|nr:MAG: cytochrome c family protein [Rhodospirillaceae bacterium]
MKMSRLFAVSLAATMTLVLVPNGVHAEGTAAAGEKIFARCKACHTAEKGGPHRVGPNLFGVVGRACGSTDFSRYSAGMKACTEKKVAWDGAQLASYIVDASKFLEGLTGKKGQGMTPQKLDDQQLADMIAYLSSLK